MCSFSTPSLSLSPVGERREREKRFLANITTTTIISLTFPPSNILKKKRKKVFVFVSLSNQIIGGGGEAITVNSIPFLSLDNKIRDPKSFLLPFSLFFGGKLFWLLLSAKANATNRNTNTQNTQER